MRPPRVTGTNARGSPWFCAQLSALRPSRGGRARGDPNPCVGGDRHTRRLDVRSPALHCTAATRPRAFEPRSPASPAMPCTAAGTSRLRPSRAACVRIVLLARGPVSKLHVAWKGDAAP
eukprot:scaffold2200_cov413-Prasinococcus_capsulatus_cf.AAC.8